jgi:hypothetical protein
MIKALMKLGIERMYLNIIKAIASIILTGKTKTIFSNVRNEARVSTLSTLIQHSPGIPSQSNKKERRNKRNSNRKRRLKLSLFADNMVLYIKDLENSSKKPLDIIKAFSKITGHEINLKNPVACLKTSNEQTEKEYGSNSIYFFSFIYMCIQCLGHYSPLPPYPLPPLSPSLPPLYQAKTILPLSLILLKREYKEQGFLLVEIRIAIQGGS